MEKAGIGAESFPWPPAKEPDRAPYRGLKPLEAVDAAVFFGRDADILRGMETLRDMRQTRIGRLLVILGASGSGKSSFMRAGLLPRLARDDKRFFCLPVVRPRNAVLLGDDDSLAAAIASASRDLRTKRTRGDVEKWLTGGPEMMDSLMERLVLEVSEKHKSATETAPPSLLIPIDQGEELFNPEGVGEAAAFMTLLGRLLASQSDAPALLSRIHGQVMAVLTIRSDRYERLQAAPEFAGIAPRLLDLRPFPTGQFERVINGPAERSTKGNPPRPLKVEPALSRRLLDDFAQGADTLPLLGFALEKLYHKYGSDGDLKLEEYEYIRGSHETVQAAIFQEAVDNALAEPFRPPAIPPEREAQEKLLRRAFIPDLVRINPETNEPMRQVAKFSTLAAEVHRLIERLVEARLLVRDKDDIEVAHESLLRQWPTLSGWLTEEKDNLRTLEKIRSAAAEWHAASDEKKEKQRDELLPHRGELLAEAEKLRDTQGYAKAVSEEDRAYLRACREAQDERVAKEKEEQNRRVRDAERIAEEQNKVAEAQKRAANSARRFAYGAGAAFVILALLSLWAYQSKVEAQLQAQRAIAGSLAIAAEKAEKDQKIDLALLLASEAAGATSIKRSDQNWLSRLLLRTIATSGTESEPTLEAKSALFLTLMAQPRLRKIWGPLSHITGVAFSPDGMHLHSADSSGNVRMWHVISGQLIAEPFKAVRWLDAESIAFSMDGTRIASAAATTIRLWNVADGELLGQPIDADKYHESYVSKVVFSPDGKRLASAWKDGTVQFWDALSGLPLSQALRGHAGLAISIAFSRDSKLLASAGSDSIVKIWDAQNAKLIGEPLKVHKIGTDATSVAFSADGRRLASGGSDGLIFLWDTASWANVGTPIKAHSGQVDAVAFSPDSQHLASGGADGTVRLWDLNLRVGEPELEPLKGHSSYVTDIAFSPDGKYIATGSHDATVRLWDTLSDQPLSISLEGLEGSVRSVVFSPDGKRLISGGDDGTMRQWDVENGRALGEPYKGYAFNLFHVMAFSPDGKYIASAGGTDGAIQLWDAANGKALGAPLKGHQGAVRSVAFDSDGRRLASGGIDGVIRLWDSVSRKALGEPLEGHNHYVMSIAFSPDGKRLASASQDETVRLWDAINGKALGKPLWGHSESVNSLAFSPDGKRLASASHDKTVRLWDAINGKALGEPLWGHSESVNSVAFSPDGKLLASASADWTVRLWDGVSGRPLGVPLRHAGIVDEVVFNRDGTRLASLSGTTVRLWDFDPRSWQKRACAIANRNLTYIEWRKYMGEEPYRKTCPDLTGPDDARRDS